MTRPLTYYDTHDPPHPDPDDRRPGAGSERAAEERERRGDWLREREKERDEQA